MITITAIQNGETLGTGAYLQERIRIGSAQGTELRIDLPDIADEHAEIWTDKGKILTRPMSEEPVLVNGAIISAVQELKPDDTLQIGAQMAFKIKLAGKQTRKHQRPSQGGRVTFKGFKQVAGEVPTVDRSGGTIDLTKPVEGAPKPAAPPPKPKKEELNEAEKKKRKKDLAIVFTLLTGCILTFYFWIIPIAKKIWLSF